MEKVLKIDEVINELNVTSKVAYNGHVHITGIIKIRINDVISDIKLELYNNDRLHISWNAFNIFIKVGFSIEHNNLEKMFLNIAEPIKLKAKEEYMLKQKEKYKTSWIHQNLELPDGVTITKSTEADWLTSNMKKLYVKYKGQLTVVEYVNHSYQFTNKETYRYNKSEKLNKLIKRIVKVVDKAEQLKQDIIAYDNEVKDTIENRLQFFNEEFKGEPYVYNIECIIRNLNNLFFTINYLNKNINFRYNSYDNTYIICNVSVKLDKFKMILNLLLDL